MIALLLLAAELTPGQVIEKVACRMGEPHSYALYLPSAYAPGRPWPILYCLDPGARGRIPVERFRAAAETYGWIVAGSNTSRNGPWDPTVAAFRALWEDTRSRFAIDDRRIYLAGFSGGARAATTLAAAVPAIAGVIGCGAGFGSAQPAKIGFAWFGAAGTDDFNYSDVRHAWEAVAATGRPTRFVTFPGAHAWPPEPVCTAAVEWLELHAMKNGRRPRDAALLDALLKKRLAAIASAEPGAASSEYAALAGDWKGLAETSEWEREAARLETSRERKDYSKREESLEKRERRLYSELASSITDDGMPAFRDLVKDLGKRAAAAADSQDRRLARRVLSGELVGLAERSREVSDLVQRKRIEEALAALRPALGWWDRR